MLFRSGYGQIIPQNVIDLAPVGIINVHASLLPKYRGAGPIQWSIVNGETRTGVTTMRIDAGLDTGDMLLKAEELATNKLPVEEVMQRRAELRRARELLFREEIKAKRIKKIKSKAYRRVHRKERLRQEKLDEEMNAEMDPDEDEQE